MTYYVFRTEYAYFDVGEPRPATGEISTRLLF